MCAAALVAAAGTDGMTEESEPSGSGCRAWPDDPARRL